MDKRTCRQAAGWRQQPHACHDTLHGKRLHTAAPTLRSHNERSVPRITHQRQQQCEIFIRGQKVERRAGWEAKTHRQEAGGESFKAVKLLLRKEELT